MNSPCSTNPLTFPYGPAVPTISLTMGLPIGPVAGIAVVCFFNSFRTKN